jgi:diadenosine tetraphosphate (Ap4A) HIT family hydrolase
MDKEIVFETRYWTVKHRSDSRYKGYLIALSNEPVLHISQLSMEALAEMSLVLAQTEKLLITAFDPYRVITFKMGFAKDVNCHFNFIPVSLGLLAEIEDQKACSHEKPDGSDSVLYVCRKYCERDLTDAEYQELVATVATLRDLYKNL